MELFLSILLVLAGLALLTGGGEALVRGASAIALLAGVTPAVVGLTVVAMGTSVPELVVSVLAAIRGQPDITVGNVVGSNIFNVTATLGLTALVLPLRVHGTAVRLEWPVMFVASCLAAVLMRHGHIGSLEGGLFLTCLVAFTAYAVRLGRREVAGTERVKLEEAVEDVAIGEPRRRRVLLALLATAAGAALLGLGGRLLVDGASDLARLAGLSERVIGLTVVAAGTGAPELAASLVATWRGRTDVALANLVGSSTFNLLGILGLSALAAPLTISPEIAGSDAWWMVGTAALLFPMLRSGRVVSRAEGATLVAVYVVYLALLLR